MFAKEAEALAQEFWNIYLQKHDTESIERIMSMCGDKFVIMGMKDSKTATDKAQFKAEMKRVFARRSVDLEITGHNFNSVPTGRNACVVFGEVSVSGTLHSSTYFYTYGFTMAVRKEKDVIAMNYLHCWRMNKDNDEDVKNPFGNSIPGKREWYGINVYRRAMDSTRDLVFGIDIAAGTVYCDDDRAKEMLGIEEKVETFEVLHDVASKIVHSDDLDLLESELDAYVASVGKTPRDKGFVSQACRICYLKEGYIWCKIGLVPLHQGNESVRRFVGYIRDINRFKEKEQLVRFQSNLDTLTGCDNVAGARKKVEQHIHSMHAGGTMLLFDINELKWINQHAGYDVGDQVLFDFAAILKRYVREDDIIARVDSDDFMVYIKGTRSKDSLKRTVGEIFEEFSDYIYNRDLDERIRCFAVAAWFGENGNSYDEMYCEAVARMERIKRRGKRNYML